MPPRQFSALFICNLITWFVGAGLLPLLPLYAADLGAGPVWIGNYLALAYLALASGTAGAGWVTSKLQRRPALIVAAGLICSPLTWLMGQIGTIWQLTILTTLIWFIAGFGLSITGILAGLWSTETQRGRIFGTLALTSALGGLLGGLTIGLVVDVWGYPTLFALLAAFWLVQSVSGLALRDKPLDTTGNASGKQVGWSVSLGLRLMPLLSASFLFGVSTFIGVLGRSLTMDALGFGAGAVSLNAAGSAGFGLALNPLAGYLSDKLSRRWLLLMAYGGNGLALVLMAQATSLAEFWWAALLIALGGTEGAVGAALITDLLSAQALDRGLALFNALRLASGIFGFAGTGFFIQIWGLPATLLGGALLTAMAMLCLMQLGQKVNIANGI